MRFLVGTAGWIVPKQHLPLFSAWAEGAKVSHLERYASRFSAPVDSLLQSFQIARVAADPPKGSELAARPGGWPGLCYWRLHGAPRTYYSPYEEHWLRAFAERLQLLDGWSGEKEIWVTFDNTVLGHATANAVLLDDALRQEHTPR